ncbi:hypothetical protein [Gemmobacter sp.]|uniref:hypothetical protein n=1 Tax=Gemmobacter sp. TaxID=1898957 RepID=UPI002AFEFD3D|nr:hypothetical protein [Gemmobacter sp.]
MSTIQPRSGEGVIATTIRLPRLLRDEVKIQAIRMGRSFNTHVAMILGAAAGAEFGDATPAAGKAQQMNQHKASTHADD